MLNSKKFKIYNEKDDLNTIIFELKNQKIGIIKTDTILGIIALDEDTIYKAKKRPTNKKIIKFIKDTSQLNNLSELQNDFLKTFWPGQVTIVYNGESYRHPDVPLINNLLDYLQVIYCSSANITGNNTITEIHDANIEFSHINYYNIFLVDNNVKNNENNASTIVDINKWIILREGARKFEVQEWIKQKIKK